MIRSFARRAGLGAALAAAALSADAATMTLNAWTFGNGNHVHASAPAYSGLAGGFTGTLSGSGTALDGPIQTYCVELGEHFTFGAVYGEYTVVDASSYFAPAKALALGRLVSHVFGNDLFAQTAASRRDDQSTALQLAIWNLVYDGDATLGGGVFADSSVYRAGNAHFLGADQLLAQSAAETVSYDLYVLSSGRPLGTAAGHQDQLVWRVAPTRTTDQVPEPGSLALVGAACLGLVSARRKGRRFSA
jgi:hypothetical protein